MPIRPSPARETCGPPRPSGTWPSVVCSIITRLRRASLLRGLRGVDALACDVAEQDRGGTNLLGRPGERVPVEHDEVRKPARLDSAGLIEVVHVRRPCGVGGQRRAEAE